MNLHHASAIAFGFFLLTFFVGRPSGAEDAVAEDPALRGYRFLVEQPTLTSDFSEEVFDQVWRSWPEPLRSAAEKSSPEQRREMAFERYGLTPRPGDSSGKPLQYVVDAEGNWTMNCFACHGGEVYGQPMPGAPNNRFALQTMTEELRATKFRLGQPLSRMDIGALVIPLGTTHGTTNAVVFGMGLMSHRDEELNVINTAPQAFDHHDMDAPPWWYFYKRPYLYIDGFAQKGHRGLMQFTLIPENGPEFFHQHEDEFRDVFAYLSSLRPPKYPGAIDEVLAGQGRGLFEDHCAECHGTYGEDWSYPNRRVPIDEVGTDPVRLTALTVEGRRKYANSWFAHAGERDVQATEIDPDGYVAPPLDGVWASAPYFHNGSVPTLWHVLNPDQRPAIWRRVGHEMDEERVGLRFATADKVPLVDTDAAIRRSYFDTNRRGKSKEGHTFPAVLNESQRRAILEYLKTL
jgi:mono/diheme cytochrome c family protein